MTPILCSSKEVGGWTSVYYLCGGLGIVWVLFWSIFASNYADNNRWISQKEQDYILDVVNLKKRKEQVSCDKCLITVIPDYIYTGRFLHCPDRTTAQIRFNTNILKAFYANQKRLKNIFCHFVHF
ncbi:hypothetical protein L596_020697 [Steinernema carpocapsae]|uniref:Uncharacterized protein n=1 Tax=Steinernema carpocapsae TaxID=34508 RepID=A0A4U5MV32_STECR|nr:hypothetical protein L596_020697 [Steinernema carpocapsae]